MSTRRVFIKYLFGLSAGLLPWYEQPALFNTMDDRELETLNRNKFSIQNKATNVISKTNIAYLNQTALKDILALTQPELQGRRAGSVGEEKAAAYIMGQMQGLGLSPLGDLMENNQRNYYHTFTIYPVEEKFENFYFGRHLTFASGNPSGLHTPSANIIGGLMGTNSSESVILSAHYDHMGIFQGNLYSGANDNASGVGCILDVMRRLIKEGVQPKRNVVLAFWSAEEMGFVGSFSFVKNPTLPLDGIQAVFNVDTVGNGPLQNFALWSEADNKAVQAIQSAANENNISAPLIPNYGYNSDHYYFNIERIPAVSLMARDWLNKNHTPEDIPDFVNPQKIAIASDILYKAVHGLII